MIDYVSAIHSSNLIQVDLDHCLPHSPHSLTPLRLLEIPQEYYSIPLRPSSSLSTFFLLPSLSLNLQFKTSSTAH